MDDLLREFLTETNESLDVVDVELVRFEQEPNNANILDNVFRLVHTIKGTCGFLGLPRLEALTHAAETLMGKFRDGMPVTGEAVSVILATIDRIKELLDQLERTQSEAQGGDRDLIERLERMSHESDTPLAMEIAPEWTVGTDVYQVLERPLRPGEVSLDELERAFRETPGPTPAAQAAPQPQNGATTPADTAHDKTAADRMQDEGGGKVASQSLRVNVDTLDHLMTMVSELVLTRNQLLEIVRRHEDSEFKVPLQRLSNVTAELQEGVMKTRMQPIGNAWQKLPRIVRDLANELGKDVELELHGSDTELDRQVLDLIKDPLIHMVRNCVDHGLEQAYERRAAGKPEKGLIRLSAYHQGGQIIVEIADDGRGLDADKIKARALASGLIAPDQHEAMSEAQIHKLIFRPGFSTVEHVTSVSGRGVGMDVVNTNIDRIGGTVDVTSVRGEGSSFIIKIPLTLAIVPALIVEASGQRFAIPQSSVVELVRVRSNSEHRIERIKDAPVLRLRNKLLPLVDLRQILQIGDAPGEADKGFIVVAHVGNQSFGILVDGVFHTEEIVVKPMSRRLRHIDTFSGNTVLGDGSVIIILDPSGVARALGAAVTAQDLNAAEASTTSEAADEQAVSLLVFRAGSTQPKAVPLSLVTRLEEVDGARIELSNGRHMVQYRGQLMPLVRVNEAARIRQDGSQPLLVFSDAGRSMGLAVDEIVDIVEDRLDIELASERPGVLGSAIIKGQATEVLDVAHFLPLAFEDRFRRKAMNEVAAKHAVLLVDDSVFFRDMLALVLKVAGYRVTTAASGVEALALLKSGQRFDVVLTDIGMPEMDGYELAQALRDDPNTAELPIIALSSMISPEAIERGRQVGFHDYVVKFDRAGLIAALKEKTADLTLAA